MFPLSHMEGGCFWPVCPKREVGESVGTANPGFALMEVAPGALGDSCGKPLAVGPMQSPSGAWSPRWIKKDQGLRQEATFICLLWIL